MDEEQIIKARFKDLAKRAYSQNTYTYTGFLTPAELGLLEELSQELSYVGYTLYDQDKNLDRQMVCFGREEQLGYKPCFPLAVIKVTPLVDRFSDQLTHRDFLGALMNLGIERNVLGDILVREGKKAYIYCQSGIAPFIIGELTRIKHTSVQCVLLEEDEEFKELAPSLRDMDVIVSSSRFDALAAAVTKLSRGNAQGLFSEKKVTLNGRLWEKGNTTLKEGDIFSIRGYGKFKYLGLRGETRKGRIYVQLQQYI